MRGNRKRRNILKLIAYAILSLLLISIIVSIPFIINESYKTGVGYITLWNASDMLNFYGTILSFAGTVILGLVAWFLNVKANQLNKRLTNLEERRFTLETQPYAVITDWVLSLENTFDVVLSPKKLYFEISPVCSDWNSSCLSLSFTNTSNTFISIHYSTAKVYKNDKHIDTWCNGTVNQQKSMLFLNCGETREIVFYCKKEKMETFLGTKICLELILENRFSERYKESIDIIIPTMKDLDKEKGYIHIHPQNYRIQKFIYEGDGSVHLDDKANFT